MFAMHILVKNIKFPLTATFLVIKHGQVDVVNFNTNLAL